MKKIPVINSQKIQLRPFNLSDVGVVSELMQDTYIQQCTTQINSRLNIDEIETWLSNLGKDFSKGERLVFAIEDTVSQALVGCMGMGLNRPFESGDIFFWIGKEFRNQGFCDVALKMFLKYSFVVLKLNRVEAQCFDWNEPSKRVLLKNHFQLEGVARESVKKNGQFEDLCQYAILKSEFVE